jgi:hypothetical protein
VGDMGQNMMQSSPSTFDVHTFKHVARASYSLLPLGYVHTTFNTTCPLDSSGLPVPQSSCISSRESNASAMSTAISGSKFAVNAAALTSKDWLS